MPYKMFITSKHKLRKSIYVATGARRPLYRWSRGGRNVSVRGPQRRFDQPRRRRRGMPSP
ncbi:hypothetical protein KCU71_g191, partial [Aureobasidium melanogenum]